MRTFPTAALLLLMALTGVVGVLLGAAWPASAVNRSLTAAQASVAQPGQAAGSNTAVAAPSATDIGFAQSMIAHHNQAIMLAMMMSRHPNPLIRGMAETIRLKQGHETGVMLGWLSAWEAPPMAMQAMAWVQQTHLPLTAEDELFISRCTSNPGQMPGQVSAGEMERLKNASASEQARLFLQLMKRHHEAALEMAAFASRHVSLTYVKSFSLSVIREQGREIAWMTHQLSSNPTL